MCFAVSLSGKPPRYIPPSPGCVQHPAELGLIQQADGADGTEELVQDVPAAANFIDQRWHINRRGFLDGIAVDALPDEPLMGASPASVLVIETGRAPC